MAQREADGISTRVRRQKQQRRELGLPHGGRRPLGWRNLMEPDPVEAAALRDAMEAVVRGASLFEIAARWQAADFGGPGRVWGGTDVRRILISPRHAGLIVHRGEIMVDMDGNEIRAAWPAIVSRDLWEACRSVLAARATGVGIARRRSLMTGLLRCGVCGAKMTRTSTPRGRDSDGKVNQRRSIWRCWRDKGGCGAVSIGAEPLEAVVIEALFEYVDGDELRAALAHRDDGRVRAIRADLTALDVRRRSLAKAFTDGGDPNVLRMASDALDGQRKKLEAELGAASARSPLDGYSDASGALRAAWPAMTTDQQRAALEAALGTVTIAPATAVGRRFDPTRIRLGSEVTSTPQG